MSERKRQRKSDSEVAPSDELAKLRAAAASAANSIFASILGQQGAAEKASTETPVQPVVSGSAEVWPEFEAAPGASSQAASPQQPLKLATELAQAQETLLLQQQQKQQALLAEAAAASAAEIARRASAEAAAPREAPAAAKKEAAERSGRKRPAATSEAVSGPTPRSNDAQNGAKKDSELFRSPAEATRALTKTPSSVPMGVVLRQKVAQKKVRIEVPMSEATLAVLKIAVEVSREIARHAPARRRKTAPAQAGQKGLPAAFAPAPPPGTEEPVLAVVPAPGPGGAPVDLAQLAIAQAQAAQAAEKSKKEQEEEAVKQAQEDEEAAQLALAQQVLAAQEAQAASLAAVMAAAADASNPSQQATAQIYLLAQLAEESSRMASAAASTCANPELDPTHATALAQAGQEAAQRASWSSSTTSSCFPNNDCAGQDKEDWVASMRQIVRSSAEAAESAAQNCRVQAQEIAHKLPPITGGRSRVPCKWFVTGVCRKGNACEFSHDPFDFQARPLQKKRAELCVYHQRGNCTRGTACPFAHGDTELAEISKIATDSRTEKRFFPRGGGLYGRSGCVRVDDR